MAVAPPPDDRPALVVSACLLGIACNHEGRGSARAVVDVLARHYHLVAVCPEVAGGLPTPRPAAEILPDGRVVTATGDDVTSAYQRGAAVAVALARGSGARRAVLKARSPSCGSSEVYDGSFSRRLVPGAGITAQALRETGVDVRSDEDADAFLPGTGSRAE